ncbi:MAG: alpha/beta hydrolase, partial [Acidiferrobacteraceae bacterium]|nr:alpha/beta hydrolase [Acidiferrobacteraceae bacterium]
VRLLQGLADTEVPWRTALRLSKALAASDVRVQLLKDGDHRLSSPAQLDLLGVTLAELLETVSQD